MCRDLYEHLVLWYNTRDLVQVPSPKLAKQQQEVIMLTVELDNKNDNHIWDNMLQNEFF